MTTWTKSQPTTPGDYLLRPPGYKQLEKESALVQAILLAGGLKIIDGEEILDLVEIHPECEWQSPDDREPNLLEGI